MNQKDIIKTIDMIVSQHLDIRTITMGISLMDCISDDAGKTADNIKKKIAGKAKDLVSTGESIEKEFGIPIVNKRISVTPVSLLSHSCGNPVLLARALDEVGKDVGVDFLGGYSVFVHKGYTDYERGFIETIPEALSETEILCSSVNVATTKVGINMDAVYQMGGIIKRAAEMTADKGCIGAAKLVVFANAVEDNPFMAGAFHGTGEAEAVINVGISGPGVVKKALENKKGVPFDEVCETIKKTAFSITRAGELVAREASRRLGVQFGIVDLSLAPTPAVGDSVARIIEEMGIEACGAHGTTAALALLNDAVKKGGVMASSHVGGLSGAFIPVSEDEGMISAVSEGSLGIEKLEAMTSVCSVGLDMIALPGDVPQEVIAGIIADEAAIGVINGKTTAVRIIPAIGHGVGDTLSFGGLLGEAPVMDYNRKSQELFVKRGGRIAAPIHALRN
ncbi:MAG: PFL family protein [Christensenellaceae bacterium]|nr:PFL family protein [Christensenellaceae bacterium]